MAVESLMNPVKAAAAQRISELEQIVMAHWTLEVFRRFQCVWLSYVLDLPAHEIAKVLGLHVATVRRIGAEFAREGILVIAGKGNRGGRRNQCMSFEEESAFLQKHTELFNRSGVVAVGALKEAFEASVGRTIHKTTIYRLLERHGRKKIGADAGRLGGEATPVVAHRKGSPGPKRKVNRVR